MADTPTATNNENTGTSRSPVSARIKVLAFVTLVIAVECALAYLYLPSASPSSALLAGAPAAPPEGHAEKHAEPAVPNAGEPGEPSENMEVDLGQFTITAYQPASATTLRIDFHLFGTIGRVDDKDFQARWEENRHRFREQVIVTVRSAEMVDLTDASLGLIRRTILDKANKALGKPLLRAVIFSDFSFIEQ